MPSLTRGPLPARVYWRRRMLAIGLAFALVLGIGVALRGGSDASSPASSVAQQAAAEQAPATGTPSVAQAPTVGPTLGPKKGKKGTKAPLAEPDGTCVPEDISVTPDVKKAIGGPSGGVVIALHLLTLESEACTWQVSARSLTVSITSGSDAIWSSRECPRAVPDTEVVVRRAAKTTVKMTWNARRSDEECSPMAGWALPGYYHVTVAALGGEPSDEQFRLLAPQAPVITRSPSPTAEPSKLG